MSEDKTSFRGAIFFTAGYLAVRSFFALLVALLWITAISIPLVAATGGFSFLPDSGVGLVAKQYGEFIANHAPSILVTLGLLLAYRATHAIREILISVRINGLLLAGIGRYLDIHTDTVNEKTPKNFVDTVEHIRKDIRGMVACHSPFSGSGEIAEHYHKCLSKQHAFRAAHTDAQDPKTPLEQTTGRRTVKEEVKLIKDIKNLIDQKLGYDANIKPSTSGGLT